MDKMPLSRIASVYSGKPGRCCCGCSGKYSYASKHSKWSSKDRGYEVQADEISDRSVKIIYNKIMSFPESELDWNDDRVSIDTDTRRYILYFVV